MNANCCSTLSNDLKKHFAVCKTDESGNADNVAP